MGSHGCVVDGDLDLLGLDEMPEDAAEGNSRHVSDAAIDIDLRGGDCYHRPVVEGLFDLLDLDLPHAMGEELLLVIGDLEAPIPAQGDRDNFKALAEIGARGLEAKAELADCLRWPSGVAEAESGGERL